MFVERKEGKSVAFYRIHFEIYEKNFTFEMNELNFYKWMLGF